VGVIPERGGKGKRKEGGELPFRHAGMQEEKGVIKVPRRWGGENKRKKGVPFFLSSTSPFIEGAVQRRGMRKEICNLGSKGKKSREKEIDGKGCGATGLPSLCHS